MDETEARQVQRRASAYSIINNELVKRSSTGVFQRCVEQDKGIEILLDIHQESLILKCEGCQRFSQRSHQPASALQTIPIAWPFAVWGLDMVGAFKTARGGMTHLLNHQDNGTNFAKGALAQYCFVSGIRLNLASVAHPQSNGQVERANGLILSGIKPRLVEPLIRLPGSWLDELPAVL
ncbi:uncharacterized protein [Aegilops tauschii subsp. strangulata]|uniref:uncharacterized protein n=1 Tax=Aegilops tauschii subsp. strangulata TaxID=200361 RepID=UPI001ABC1268|nr:uncharacterized protein LOC109733801 [Aegilops tauschii subsp. strangulata]